MVSLECKTYVKYLGVLIDENLSWKHHINYTSTKIGKGIGIIARLRQSVRRTTLLNIYCSLIEPYLSYGLVSWGQAANAHLKKVVILQKRVLHLMYFSDYTVLCKSNANEFRQNSWLFVAFRRNFAWNDIATKFPHIFMTPTCNFSNDNLLCSMIHPKFSSDNSLLSKSRCDFSNDNSLLPKIR